MSKDDPKLEIFKILDWNKGDLIAKTLYDNGIKNEDDFINWVQTAPLRHIPLSLKVSVINSFRDFKAGFTDINEVPNILNLE